MSKRPSWWLPVLAKIWPLTWISARATNWPLVGPVIARLTLPLFTGKNLNVSYIPINKSIEGAASTFLPGTIVEELIRQSAHRVIIKKCTCRDAKQCDEHPVDFGCTLLGEGTKEIDPRIADHVTVDEAILHLHKTIENGLIPMTGRVKIDNFIWGVKDRGKLLTVCHCCRCCCTILASGKYLPEKASESIKKLNGLKISVDHEKCIQCGDCISECFMAAISIEEGKVVHDEKKCKGCGRCISVCTQKATDARIEDTDAAIEEILGRIRNNIDFETKG